MEWHKYTYYGLQKLNNEVVLEIQILPRGEGKKSMDNQNIKLHISAIETHIAKLKKEISGFKSTINFLNNAMDSKMVRMEELFDEMNNLKGEVEVLVSPKSKTALDWLQYYVYSETEEKVKLSVLNRILICYGGSTISYDYLRKCKSEGSIPIWDLPNERGCIVVELI